jgi:GNAT superfamily N-acetyltransferase
MSVVPFSHTYVPQLIDQVRQSNQKFYHTCVAKQSQRVFLWVFEDRDSAEIIGFGLCRLMFDDSLLIDTLYVKPKYRRRGIVRWFIARVRHVFPFVCRLILETLKDEAYVRGERSAAITAYEALGFCQMTPELLAQLRHWFPAREHFVLPDGFLWDCLRDMYYERLVYEFPDRECKKEGVGKKIGSVMWSILSVIKTPINSTRERARKWWLLRAASGQ